MQLPTPPKCSQNKWVTFVKQPLRPNQLNLKGSWWCASTADDFSEMSRSEWWHLLQNHPASPCIPVGLWVHVALIAACRLHTPSSAFIKETTLCTLWNFYSMCSLLFSPLFLLPTFSSPFFLLKCATKQTRKTSLCHVFRLDFLPAWKHSSISLVLPLLTPLLHLPGATTWLWKQWKREYKGV